MNDPDDTVTEDDLSALRHGSVVLALELSHQRTIAEIELHLRRGLVDDLLVGTDRDGAYARADALGHDLRRPHHVVVMQTAGRTESTLPVAAERAATALVFTTCSGVMRVWLFCSPTAAPIHGRYITRSVNSLAQRPA